MDSHKIINHFTLKQSTRTILFGMMGVGALCMLLTLFLGGENGGVRFWSNFLHNSVFFTGIGFMALFVLAAKALAYSGWHTGFKRIWEAYSLFLIVGLILMAVVVVSIFLGWNHLYHWADKASVVADEVLKGKSGFLNPVTYAIFTIGLVGLWYFFAQRMRSISVAEDDNGGPRDFSFYKKLKRYSAMFLPIAGFSSAAIIWLWVMSVDAHWYSTLFAWYATASWLVAMIALTVLMLLFLKANGYYANVTADHLHDLGKYLFGFSIFWTYLWFSQYMLIWYGNVGEETIYFKERMDNYQVLFYGNIVINFVLPFFILLRNDTKRKFGTMGLTALIVFVGHWLDFFLMLKPGILHTAHELSGHGHGGGHSEGGEHGLNALSEGTARLVSGGEEIANAAHEAAHHVSHFTPGFTLPGVLELGTMIGFFGLFAYISLRNLEKANLVPTNDPYIQESLHHHVV